MNSRAAAQAARIATRSIVLVTVLASVPGSYVWAQSMNSRDALKAAEETLKDIRANTGTQPSPQKLPPGDPCALLPLAEVRKAFPGASAGERDRRLEQEEGITECAWKGADGKEVLTVQEMYYSTGTAREEAQTMALGAADPTKPLSHRNVRVEAFPRIGSEAAGFVEKIDASRGIMSDIAFLAVRQGDRMLWLGSGDLPRRDRTAALKVLAELGRLAAQRLP